MPVLDASAVVVLLVDDPQRLTLTGPSGTGARWAPHLLDAEVGHVIRRRVARGALTAAAGARAVADLRSVPIRRSPHGELLDRAWELRENLSFYDALYVALAERLEMSLVTLDRRLAGAPGLRCAVEVLPPR